MNSNLLNILGNNAWGFGKEEGKSKGKNVFSSSDVT